MQSNRLALVAPLCVILAAAGATNFACSNSDDDNNNAQADSGVYIDGGIQQGVPPGSGYTPPAGDDDDDDDDGGMTMGGGEGGTTPPTDGGGDTGATPPTDAGDAGDSGGGGTAPTVLAVLRVGDGTTAVPGAETTASTFIDFYKIADGTSGGTSVTFGATWSTIANTLGGGLALSSDGHYLAVGGYTAAPNTVNAAALTRSVARVSAAGTIDTSTVVGAFNNGTTAYIRDVASVDGTGFWVTGSSGTSATEGTFYVPFGDTGSGSVQLEQATPAPAATRQVGIFGGQLYVSAATATFDGVGTVGTGTPKTGPQTPALVVTDTATGDPEGFVGLDTDTTAGVDTFYVADATTGLHKWKLSGGTFAEVGTALTFGAGAAAGARAVTGFVSGTSIKLFVTTDDGTTIQSVTDTTTSTTNGTVGAAAFATAGTDKAFRGIAFAAQ